MRGTLFGVALVALAAPALAEPDLTGTWERYPQPGETPDPALVSPPIPDPPLQRARRRIVLEGEIPNPMHPPSGCRFQTRCPLVEDRCRVEPPPLEEKAPGHFVACHFR